jgi:hypothetical protein
MENKNKIDFLNGEDQELWDKLGNNIAPEVSSKVKTNFYAMLELQKNEQSAVKPNVFKTYFEHAKNSISFKPKVSWAAAAMLVLFAGIGGYFMGKPKGRNVQNVEQLSADVQEMKQLMLLAMLENPTATERIKAVNYTQELNNVDNQVIEALFTTLNFDQNENVRLITLEALVELAHNPKVRAGLVKSLLKQESPLMQVALADVMVKLQMKTSVKEFKELLKKENLDKTVKIKIERTIGALS